VGGLRGQEDRCRAVFELAISQPLLDMPELLWKAYIGEHSTPCPIHTYIHTYTHPHIHTHSYIHTHLHICIHTYMHTIVRTCIHAGLTGKLAWIGWAGGPADYEYGEGAFDRTRQLYERLLKRTEHVKVRCLYLFARPVSLR
jgi:hypothetical protein